MQVCLEWLEAFQRNQHDDYWLGQHGEEIYHAIQQSLASPPKFDIATELLVKAFPYYALNRLDITRWVNLLIDAMLVAQELGDIGLRTRLMEHIGSGRLAEGHFDTAHFAYLYVLEHAHDYDNPDIELAAHTGLIWLQTIYQGKPSSHNETVIENALQLAQVAKNPATIARLHHALTSVYTQQQCPEKALQFGQMAYTHWHIANDKVEQAKTAYSLAAVYRMMNRFELADAYLEIAEDVFSRTNYRRQYTLTIYERGVLRWKQEKYEEAAQWLELAWKEAVGVGINFHIAAAAHTLGRVYLKLKDLDKARESLKSAALIWDELDNKYEQTSVMCHFIRLERLGGNLEAAREWGIRARLICAQITQEHLRKEMEAYIEEVETVTD